MTMNYTVNFPNDLIFNGKTTRFLRIKNNEANTIYVTVMPANIADEGAQFLINGVSVAELYAPTTTTYINNDQKPVKEYWQPVNSGKEYAWRIDYNGEEIDKLKLSVFINANDPVNGTKYADSINLDIVAYPIQNLDSRTFISNKPLETTKLNASESSSLMIRTNPMLSGNVKLTVDSSNDIWLNSIDANDHLSNARFKKFKVSPNSSYAADLYNFLDKGQVPTDVLFDIKEYDKLYETTKKEYHLQFDNFYAYGVSQLKSNLYDEEFSFFAPLWLNNQLPSYFIILRVDHPVSLASYTSKDNTDILKEVLSSAKILKTFDLRKGTKVGTYINNIISHNLFSQNPIDISYRENIMSSWTGISYKDGQVAHKGEYLHEYFQKDRTIKETDEYITSGFKRNSLICQNLVNLEFLFDDTDADPYSINRYIGLYVNEIELQKINLDASILSTISNEIQSPAARKNIDAEPYATIVFNQTNNSGIEIPLVEYRNDTSYINELSNAIANKNKFVVLKNRENNFSRINSISYKETSDFDLYANLKLYDTHYNIGSLTGIETLRLHESAELLDESASQCVIYLADTLNDSYVFNPNDEIIISWDRSGEHHTWKLLANETGLQEGDWWDYPVYNVDTKEYINTFNPKGSPSNVAKAVAGCINQFDTVHFEAVALDDKVYIKSKRKYDGANDFAVTVKFARLRNNVPDNKDNVKFYGISKDTTKYELQGEYAAMKTNFKGGNTRKRNRAKISFTSGKNLDGQTWLQTQSNKFSEIKSFKVNESSLIALPYLDEPIYDNNNLIGFKDIDKYLIIEIENDTLEIYSDVDKKISGFHVFSPSLSILSIFPIQDFDFDFYSSQYAYSPTGELYAYFDEYEIKTGESLELPFNDFYKVAEGTCMLQGLKDGEWETITEPDTSLNSNELFNTYNPGLIPDNNIESPGYLWGHTYDKIRILNTGGSICKIETYLYMKKNGEGIFFNASDETEKQKFVQMNLLDIDMSEFKGFSALKDFLSDADESFLDELIKKEDFNRFFVGMLFTEYDKLQENNLKEWAVKSKVVPYINKWVSQGTDVNDNAYRLNTSNAFGTTCFSPSFESSNDPSSFTHEWLYLDEHPNKFPKEFVSNARGYMFQRLDECPFDNSQDTKDYRTWYDLLKDTTVDYFTKYFTVGYPNEIYDGETVLKNKAERYTFFKDASSVLDASTMFHGTKIEVIETEIKNEIKEKVKDSVLYNDYKFSAVLRRKEVNIFANNKLYDIEIIDNRAFKTITFIVTILIQDFKLKRLSYSGLYTLSNAYKADSVFLSKGTTNKLMSYNKFGVVTDMNDIILQGVDEVLLFKETLNDTYGINFDEFRKINTGSLENAYANVSSFEKDQFGGFAYHTNNPVNNRISRPVNMLYSKSDNFSIDNRYSLFYGPMKSSSGIEVSYERAFAKYNESSRYDNYTASAAANLIYMNSGQTYYSEISKLLSLKEISKLNNVTYISYPLIDSSIEKSKDRFALNFVQYEKIEKITSLTYEKDSDKPEVLHNIDLIGYNLASNSSYTEHLYRYSGKFQPARRNVFEFYVNELPSFVSTFNKDLTLCNTSILESSGVLKNHFYNKVNESEILKISNGASYKSMYPLVDEIAIEKKDTNIIKSTWDGEYYIKHTTVSTKENVDGMQDFKESNAFMGTTVMNVPTNYEFYSFNDSEYSVSTTTAIGANVNTLNNVGSIAAIDSGKNSIDITFKIADRLVRDAIDNEAKKELDWISQNLTNTVVSNMSDAEKNDYIKKYLQSNIVELYNTSSIVVYAKHVEKGIEKYPLNLDTHESKLINTGYLKYNSFTITKINELDFMIKIFIDTTKYQMFAIGVQVKRI